MYFDFNLSVFCLGKAVSWYYSISIFEMAGNGNVKRSKVCSEFSSRS